MNKKIALISSLLIVVVVLFMSCPADGNAADRGVPNNLKLIPGDEFITVIWDAAAEATGYEVWFNTKNDTSDAEKVDESKISNTTCEITGIENGTTYYVWVKAVYVAGISDFSKVESAIPYAAITIPDVPQKPTGVNVTPGNLKLTITWTAVENAESYTVYCETTNEPENAKEVASEVTSPTYTITELDGTSLKNGTTYYVWITAENEAGISAKSEVASGVPLEALVTTTEIEGVSIPVVGVTPLTTLTENNQYTGSIEWKIGEDAFTGNTFEAENIYTAIITLNTKTGYTFTGIEANVFSVAEAPEGTTASNDAGNGAELVVTVIFPQI